MVLQVSVHPTLTYFSKADHYLPFIPVESTRVEDCLGRGVISSLMEGSSTKWSILEEGGSFGPSGYRRVA